MKSIATVPKKECNSHFKTKTFSGGTIDIYFSKLKSNLIFKKHAGWETSWINLSVPFLFKIHYKENTCFSNNRD